MAKHTRISSRHGMQECEDLVGSEPGILSPGSDGEHHEIANGSHQFHTIDVGLVDVGFVVWVVLVVFHLGIVKSTYHDDVLQGGNEVLMFVR